MPDWRRFLVVVVLTAMMPAVWAEEKQKAPSYRGGRVNVWLYFGYAFGDLPKAYSSLPAPDPDVALYPLSGLNSALTFSIEPEYAFNERLAFSAAIPVALFALEATESAGTVGSLFDEGSTKVFQLGDAVAHLRYSPIISRRSGLHVNLSVGRDFGTSDHIAVGDGIAATSFGLSLSRNLGPKRIVSAYGRREELEGSRGGANLYGVSLSRLSRLDSDEPRALALDLSVYDTSAGSDLRLAIGLLHFNREFRPKTQVFLQMTGLASSDHQVLVGYRFRVR